MVLIFKMQLPWVLQLHGNAQNSANHISRAQTVRRKTLILQRILADSGWALSIVICPAHEPIAKPLVYNKQHFSSYLGSKEDCFFVSSIFPSAILVSIYHSKFLESELTQGNTLVSSPA